jgi:uncharacterized membrane protein
VRRQRDERGSILPMTVLLITVMLTFTAFAVDLGVKRVARRDMQSLADVVAMDLARHLGGRSASTILADPAWRQVKTRALAQNPDTAGTTPNVVPVLGVVDDTTGAFRPVAGSDVPNAVKVIAETTVAFAFAGGTGSTGRSAIAKIDPVTCFSVGSFAASLDLTNSPLNALLGNIIGVNLKVLHPDGILVLKDVSVPLAGIAVKLGVGTAEELLELENLTVAKFLTATAAVLTDEGDTVQAAFLKAIVLRLQALPSVPLDLASILTLGAGAGADAALDLDVHLLDLISGALLVANGTESIAVPALEIDLPGLTNISAKLAVTSAPKIACGQPGTTASSAQVKVQVDAKVGGVVEGLASSDLHFEVEIAAATGTLAAVHCGTGGAPDRTDITVVSSLVRGLALNLKMKVAGFLLGSLLSIGADVTSTSVGTSGRKSLQFTYPEEPDLPAAQTVQGLASLNLASAHVQLSGLAGLANLLSPILSGVVRPLLLVLDPLLTALLTPVLRLVGLNLGGAEVAMESRADCSAPSLVG